MLVASVFVNPAQFSERRQTSPRTRATSTRDAAFAGRARSRRRLRAVRRRDVPAGFATWVEPGGAAEGLESAYRPGHFRGVATVCLKLFNLVRPQIAWFGRKDAQQVAVVKQLVRDLNVPVEIRVVETVRDHDGLAFSSRNARLSAEERERARALPRALETRDAARGARRARSRRASSPTTSRSRTSTAPPSLVAARVGSTRLIDNVPLPKGDTLVTTRPRKPAPGTPAPGKLPLPEVARDEAPRRPHRDGDRVRRAVGRGSPTTRAST